MYTSIRSTHFVLHMLVEQVHSILGQVILSWSENIPLALVAEFSSTPFQSSLPRAVKHQQVLASTVCGSTKQSITHDIPQGD